MSKTNLVAAGLLAVTVVGAPIAYATSWYVVAVALLALPGAIGALVALDVRRRVQARNRRVEAWQKALDRRVDELAAAVAKPPARADVPSHEDLVGTVGVIQAQYAGRLDRAQSSLDEAVQALRAQLDASVQSNDGGPHEVRRAE